MRCKADPDCNRPVCAKGMCMTHYQRHRRTGKTERPSAWERFQTRLVWDNGCLVPSDFPDHRYPTVGEAKRLASHVTLEKAGFPRPEGYEVLHSCDRPACVNPEHLRWGTHAENMAEMAARGRAAVNGKRLSDEDLQAIKDDPRRPLRLIAADYGIHVATVGQIKNGKSGY